MSLYAGLTHVSRLGGIACLSGFLPKFEQFKQEIKQKNVPIFMGHGSSDNVIQIDFAQKSKIALESLGVKTDFRTYTNLQHSCSPKEI